MAETGRLTAGDDPFGDEAIGILWGGVDRRDSAAVDALALALADGDAQAQALLLIWRELRDIASLLYLKTPGVHRGKG